MEGSAPRRVVRLEVIISQAEDINGYIRFQFKASNNETEYEAMITGLNLAKIMEAQQVMVFSDSQLIVNQMMGTYAVKGELMVKYHAKVMELLAEFDAIQLIRIPRMENAQADALARLASATRTELRRTIPIEVLESRSIDEDLTMNVITLDLGPSWMDPIRVYIEEG